MIYKKVYFFWCKFILIELLPYVVISKKIKLVAIFVKKVVKTNIDLSHISVILNGFIIFEIMKSTKFHKQLTRNLTKKGKEPKVTQNNR